ncbi:hypothetical protein NY057_05310 [Curtobacterium flaccumfaciens]|uniref:hypothetical protein n=1 Tax=Curtobacterium flaccumfaciens TaxID=2035 RepID=UPI0021FD5D74|nr:hypothetical protein [Curtobacterium flaccumfaciens]UWD83664.1 hypothetical protein NY057_05310 [Curtobacterium flaccumfaciens]
MTERFIIQRAATRQVLSYDFAGVDRGGLARKLSAVSTLPLTVPSGQVLLPAEDGQPMFQEWGTLVTLDDDGQIRFRGIVTDLSYVGAECKVTVSSIPAYASRAYYEGSAYYGAQVDPADIARKVWDHLQSFPDSQLGVTVVGSTPVKVGSFSTQRRIAAEAAYDVAVKAYNAENKTLTGLRAIVAGTRKTAATRRTARAAASREVSAAKKVVTAAKVALTAAKKTKDQAKIAAAQAALNQANATLAGKTASLNDATASLNSANAFVKSQNADVTAQAKVVAAAKAAKDKASDAKSAAQRAESDDGGAFALEPWEAKDCGQIIADLAESTPFDWTEEHYWDGDVPQTAIRVAYPRAGRRLAREGDPLFQQGVNIIVQLAPGTDGSEFANSVYGIGAGEGAGAIRRSITKRDGRLRRVAKYSAKDIRTKQDMDTRLQVELLSRQEVLAVDRIMVADHRNSPRGSYGLGDDILVQGDVPHYGRFELWHRIVGITENQDGSSELELERTDTFTYGSGIDT